MWQTARALSRQLRAAAKPASSISTCRSTPTDLLVALQAESAALVFWQGLATFYRKAYLTWINGASRHPALRDERLRELVALLNAGKKQRER